MITCVWAITTYNRMNFLKQTIDSWLDTRNPSYRWVVLIADDGSTDLTLKYLSRFSEFTVLNHNRRGVHHQTNQLFKNCPDFHVGFKTDDDLIFKEKGWDTQYIEAIKETGYDHLVFHDLKWKRKKRKRDDVYHPSGRLECRSYWDDTQGAFWTFTPRVLKSVGYFDMSLYGRAGWGHRDFTMRCCKAGFNEQDNIFDITDSNRWIQLNLHQYVSTHPIRPKQLPGEETKRKINALWDSRIFVPYNTIPNCKMYL